MNANNKNTQCENSAAVLRSAIRDSKASSVQARIRITRIDRGIESLQRLKCCTWDKEEANRIELKIRQNLLMREQVLRSLVSAETRLQKLLKADRKSLSGSPPDSTPLATNQSVPAGSEV